VRPALLVPAVIALLLVVAAPAGAESVYAGRDGLISYFRSNENQGLRTNRLVSPAGATTPLPIPSNLGSGTIPGAPFRVEISPDGRLYAYVEANGTRQGRLVIGDVTSGGAHTLATAGDVAREAGRPHLAGRIGGVMFSPDGRRLAVSTFDPLTGDLTDTVVLTLDLLVDDPPDPVPAPHVLTSGAAVSNWDGNRILLTRPTGQDSTVTVAFDADTYQALGQVAGTTVRHRGPKGELIGTTFEPGTFVTSTTAGSSGATDVVRVDTGETLYNGNSVPLPANCFAAAVASCPEVEQVIDALPAPSGKGYAVLVMRWDNRHRSFMRIELHDENRQFVRVLAPEETTFTYYELQNWSAKPLPVVFVPGFLGSEITCDGTEDGAELWPALPDPPFERFRLQADGLSGETGPDRCPSAGPSALLETALTKPIYSGVANWLRGMDDVDASFLAWDWRKRPQESIARLDAMIDAALVRADTDQVQLIAHSYGGLLARLYADSPARREKLARVITLGTPYWGAVKSSFPLVSGEEMIGGGDLDPVLEQAELQQFARNLGGLYHLWPSSNFGPWLNTGSGMVGAGGIGSQIEVFGGQPDLHAQGRSLHASTLDTFAGIGTLDWTVLIGTATPTPVSLTLSSGTGADLEALIAFDDGDGTVPVRSSSLGTIPGGGQTPGASRRVVKACEVGHVPLPNDAGVQARLLPWVNTGAPVAADDEPCPSVGWHVRIEGVDLPAPRAHAFRLAAAVPPGGQGLADLERSGAVDVFGFGDDIDIVVPAGALTVPIEAPGATVTMTPLSGAVRGAGRTFPPLAAGVRELKFGATTAVEPTLDGKPATSTPTDPGPGDPGTGDPPPATGGPGPIVRPPADRIAPRTTIKVKRLKGGRVRITLRATDRGGSRVARITYRVGKKGKLQRYRKPFTLRARRLEDLRFGAVDRAGNREKLKSARR